MVLLPLPARKFFIRVGSGHAPTHAVTQVRCRVVVGVGNNTGNYTVDVHRVVVVVGQARFAGSRGVGGREGTSNFDCARASLALTTHGTIAHAASDL